MNEHICREYLGKDRGECGKPATHSVKITGLEGTGIGAKTYYKCDRHIRPFRKSGRLTIKELA